MIYQRLNFYQVSQQNKDAMKLIRDENILAFNEYRLHNLTFIPDLSHQDLSGKDLSFAYLNGAKCIQTNFSKSILKKTNLVQAELDSCNFKEADLTETLFMYAEMQNCNLQMCNMNRTNFMWANLQYADLSGSKALDTVLVEANLKSCILKDFNKEKAFLKYAKI
ncbi:MAG TPA: pentapeptide repeat-containing protein [Nitrososphaeraceae archaeon]|nr:pentapeptide repeat-containing protein [Nitrososphaeraceae archaeon]